MWSVCRWETTAPSNWERIPPRAFWQARMDGNPASINSVVPPVFRSRELPELPLHRD